MHKKQPLPPREKKPQTNKKAAFPFFIYHELYIVNSELRLLRSWSQRLFLFNEVCECWKNCETLDCSFHRFNLTFLQEYSFLLCIHFEPNGSVIK